MPTFEETIEFIKKVHEGQITRHDEPFWTHPVAVANLLPEDATEDERLAALLHDVLEDGITVEELAEAGYSQETIEIVQLVTRPGEPRPEYMAWIQQVVKSRNPSAIRVRYADNCHNADPDRIANLPLEIHEREIDYKRSTRILAVAAGVWRANK